MSRIESSLGLYKMASRNEPGQRLKWVVTVSAKKKEKKKHYEENQ